MVAALELGWMAEAVVRASLVGGAAALVAWGLCRVWRRMPPRAAAWVWRLVLLRFVAALCFRPWEVPLGEPAVLTGMRESLPFGWNPAVAPTAEADAVSDGLGWSGAVADAACMIWIAGATFGIAALVAAALRGAARRKSAPPCRHQRTLAAAAEVSAAMGLPRPPAVAVSLAEESPYLAGVRRPVVVAPTPWNFSASELRLVFAHEFAHVRQHHLMWTWAAEATCRLFFFHPLVWLAARRLNLAQEAAADQEAVAAVGGRTSDLGSLLVKIAGLASRDDLGVRMALGPSNGCDALMERLRALQRYRPPETERRLPMLLASFVAAASLGVLWTPAGVHAGGRADVSEEVSASPRRDPRTDLRRRPAARTAAAAGTAQRAPTVILSNPSAAEHLRAQRHASPESASRSWKDRPNDHDAHDLKLAAEFKARLQLLESLGFCPDAVSLRESGPDGSEVWQLEVQQRKADPQPIQAAMLEPPHR